MIGTGSFAARAAEPIKWIKSPEKGTPGVEVTVELKAGPSNGERISWIGWLTEKTTERTSESLSIMGYDGSDPSSVTKNTFIAVIEHETYSNAAGEEKVRPRVAWINDPSGGGRLDLMTAPEVAGAQERLRAAMAALKSKKGAGAPQSDVKF